MTKEIRLSKTHNDIVVLLDDEDYEWAKEYRWFYCKGYAGCSIMVDGVWKTMLMHRDILGIGFGGRKTSDRVEGDHINGNKLDNRRGNLRACSAGENRRNQSRRGCNTSGYKGVCRDKGRDKWLAYIKVNRKFVNLGRYDNILEAARAYDRAAVLYFGEYARTNAA